MALIEGFMPSSYKDQGTTGPSMGLVVPSSSPHKRRSESNKPVESHDMFVAIFLNEEGVLQTRCSASMRRHERHILHEASYKFKDIVENFVEQPAPKRQSGMHHHNHYHHSANMSMFPRDLSSQTPFIRKSSKRRFPDSYPCVERPIMLSSHRKDSLRQSRQLARGDRVISLRADDKEAQEKWFSDAFKAVQQVVCRTIAKVWIKKIHPKKQSTHPYNGLYPRNSQADPSRTKPPYWPAHVKHKEPDHIDRNARTALLVHLIMNTPQHQIKNAPDGDTLIYAQDLLLALEEKKADFKGDRWQIITQIVEVRMQIENYEMGGADPDTVIFAPDFSESSRSSRSEADPDGDDGDMSMPEGETGGEPGQQMEEDQDDGMTPTAQSPQKIPSSAKLDNQAEEIQQCQHKQQQQQQQQQQSTSNGFSNSSSTHASLNADQQRGNGTIEVAAGDPELHDQGIGITKQGSFVSGLDSEDGSIQVQHQPLPDMMDFHHPHTHIHRTGLGEENKSAVVMTNGWLHSPLSPTGFIPPDVFGLNGGPILTHDGFTLNDLNPVHHTAAADQPMLAMSMASANAHGLATGDGVTFQEIGNTSNRGVGGSGRPQSISTQGMSTRYATSLSPNDMHGLELFQQSYFAA